MTPLLFSLVVLAASFAAGLLGSLLGLGGGIIVVPVLTLLLGIDIHYAIGASIICVIATSSGSAASYVEKHMTNLRVAMLLEVATAIGAVSGAFLAGALPPRWLHVLFGLILGYTAWAMSRKRKVALEPPPPDPWADRLQLHGQFFDQLAGREVFYRVARVKVGLAVSYFAGIISGLLGVGGGVLKVPVMNLSMGIPLKVSTATSNFMIGVTAAASAAVYFMRGDILPFVAAPVAAGVLLGARTGSRMMGRMNTAVIRMIFVVVLVWTAVQMLLKGVR